MWIAIASDKVTFLIVFKMHCWPKVAFAPLFAGQQTFPSITEEKSCPSVLVFTGVGFAFCFSLERIIPLSGKGVFLSLPICPVTPIGKWGENVIQKELQTYGKTLYLTSNSANAT